MIIALAAREPTRTHSSLSLSIHTKSRDRNFLFSFFNGTPRARARVSASLNDPSRSIDFSAKIQLLLLVLTRPIGRPRGAVVAKANRRSILICQYSCVCYICMCLTLSFSSFFSLFSNVTTQLHGLRLQVPPGVADQHLAAPRGRQDNLHQQGPVLRHHAGLRAGSGQAAPKSGTDRQGKTLYIHRYPPRGEVRAYFRSFSREKSARCFFFLHRCLPLSWDA